MGRCRRSSSRIHTIHHGLYIILYDFGTFYIIIIIMIIMMIRFCFRHLLLLFDLRLHGMFRQRQ